VPASKVAKEGVDRRQPDVAGRHGVLALVLKVLQEGDDVRGGDVVDVQLGDWSMLLAGNETQQ
jgi:hypothetical protein